MITYTNHYIIRPGIKSGAALLDEMEAIEREALYYEQAHASAGTDPFDDPRYLIVAIKARKLIREADDRARRGR